MELTDKALERLKIITIFDLAMKNKVLKFSEIGRAIDISDPKAVLDLVLETIYLKLIDATIDERNQELHVTSTQGRDVRASEIDGMLETLSKWVEQIEGVVSKHKTEIDDLHSNVAESQ